MGITVTMIDNARDNALHIEIRRPLRCDRRGYLADYEYMAAGSDESTERATGGVGDEHIFPHSRRPAGRRLSGRGNGRECAVPKQSVLVRMSQRDDGASVWIDREAER